MSLERPNWNNYFDRKLYYELCQKDKLTEEEEKFFKTMYYFEEFACGLDGDD